MANPALLPTGQPDLFFEDSAVGRLKKEIWEAGFARIDRWLAEYGVPSPPEWCKPGSYIQTTVRSQVVANRRKNDVVLVPIGCTENHGSHPYHHLGMPGTVIIRENVAREFLKEAGQSRRGDRYVPFLRGRLQHRRPGQDGHRPSGDSPPRGRRGPAEGRTGGCQPRVSGRRRGRRSGAGRRQQADRRAVSGGRAGVRRRNDLARRLPLPSAEAALKGAIAHVRRLQSGRG